MTTLIWKDRQDMCVWTDMHEAAAEGNFCDEHGKAQKPAVSEDYS
jgi:hypothetical protein